MKNKLRDLNDHLFAQLERMADDNMTTEQIETEVKRADAIVAVADQIIGNASLQLKAAELFAEHGQAIHHVLEARRVELRHAGIEMVRTTFRGFVALPPPPGQKPWHEVLRIAQGATADEIDAAYKARARELAAENDQDGLRDLNTARDRARSQFG